MVVVPEAVIMRLVASGSAVSTLAAATWRSDLVSGPVASTEDVALLSCLRAIGADLATLGIPHVFAGPFADPVGSEGLRVEVHDRFATVVLANWWHQRGDP